MWECSSQLLVGVSSFFTVFSLKIVQKPHEVKSGTHQCTLSIICTKTILVFQEFAL